MRRWFSCAGPRDHEVARYKKEMAEKREAESQAWGTRSDSELRLHHRWAQATTALQIAIALGIAASLHL